jgi:hypothetical protein
MVKQDDAQPKGPSQRELVNLGCLLPYQDHHWKCQIANAGRIDDCNNTELQSNFFIWIGCDKLL